MKRVVLTDWRRRISEALDRGRFTKDDRETINGSPCGCIKGELGKILGIKHAPYGSIGNKFPITNSLEFIMMKAVGKNDIQTAENVLDIMEQIPSLYHVQR